MKHVEVTQEFIELTKDWKDENSMLVWQLEILKDCGTIHDVMGLESDPERKDKWIDVLNKLSLLSKLILECHKIN